MCVKLYFKKEKQVQKEMFKRRKKKDKKKKKSLNLDGIEAEKTDIEGKSTDQTVNLGKRENPAANPKNILNSSSNTLSTIYKKTVQNNTEAQKTTASEVIQEELKKMKFQDQQNRKTAMVKRKGVFGPVKQLNASQHSNGIDYNPSRCKDYYETGYCVFGNSCIFIHDRSDYKSGWELDRDWDMLQRKKEERRRKKLMKRDGDSDSDDDDESSEELEEYADEMVYSHIDEVCLLCGEDYRMPSLLQCGHIFCDKCALTHYSSDKSCFKCGKLTNGIFNDGTKLVKKAKAEREKYRGKGKKKKDFGHVPVYLRTLKDDLKDDGFRLTNEDEDKAVVVSHEEVQQAMKRIKLKSKN